MNFFVGVSFINLYLSSDFRVFGWPSNMVSKAVDCQKSRENYEPLEKVPIVMPVEGEVTSFVD